MSETLKLLCQIFICIILLKTIYCMLIPKPVRKTLAKVSEGLVGLVCGGLNGVYNSIPRPQSESTVEPKLKRIK